jgi:hypothetical protein
MAVIAMAVMAMAAMVTVATDRNIPRPAIVHSGARERPTMIRAPLCHVT